MPQFGLQFKIINGVILVALDFYMKRKNWEQLERHSGAGTKQNSNAAI